MWFQTAMSTNQFATSRRAVVSGSPASPWWSTLDEQTVDALSDDLVDHAGVRHGQRNDVRRPDWSVSGTHLRPRQYEILTAWRLINGRRPLGMSRPLWGSVLTQNSVTVRFPSKLWVYACQNFYLTSTAILSVRPSVRSSHTNIMNRSHQAISSDRVAVCQLCIRTLQTVSHKPEMTRQRSSHSRNKVAQNIALLYSEKELRDC